MAKKRPKPTFIPRPKKGGRKKVFQNREGFFKFDGLDGKHYRLNLREQLFVLEFLKIKGSGVDAAMNVYEFKTRKTAYTYASTLLKKPQIIAYVNLKLRDYGYTDKNAEKQLLFIMNQFGDLNAKNKALDMYHKKTGAYAPEVLRVSGLGKLLDEISDKKQPAVNPASGKGGKKE